VRDGSAASRLRGRNYLFYSPSFDCPDLMQPSDIEALPLGNFYSCFSVAALQGLPTRPSHRPNRGRVPSEHLFQKHSHKQSTEMRWLQAAPATQEERSITIPPQLIPLVPDSGRWRRPAKCDRQSAADFPPWTGFWHPNLFLGLYGATTWRGGV